ncbi:MAG: tripartite tricarboxylate transporter TctB family protein [Deltaproteobacteria bacterium]|nr:tripartite tricarboxylate transporter TctB family protein [Deltaproteobacteria bacterium]
MEPCSVQPLLKGVIALLVLDRKIALAAIAVCSIFYWATFSYTPEIVAFPRFLCYALYILAGLLFAFPRQHSEYAARIIYSKEKLLSIGMLIAYTIIFPFVGYFVTTFIFSMAYLWIFRRKGLVAYIIFAAIYLAVMYVVFQKWLYVWFPEGLLI